MAHTLGGSSVRAALYRLGTSLATLLVIAYLTLFGLIMAERGREGLPAEPLSAASEALLRTVTYVTEHPTTYYWDTYNRAATRLVATTFSRSAGLLLVSLVLAAALDRSCARGSPLPAQANRSLRRLARRRTVRGLECARRDERQCLLPIVGRGGGDRTERCRSGAGRGHCAGGGEQLSVGTALPTGGRPARDLHDHARARSPLRPACRPGLWGAFRANRLRTLGRLRSDRPHAGGHLRGDRCREIGTSRTDDAACIDCAQP